MLLADIHAYRQWKHFSGTVPVEWRSRIKHDCSNVMELRREGRKYRNGLGELVEVEDACLFPMLKSSDLANGCRIDKCRWLIVTQKAVGDETREIERVAPKTWAYLTAHTDLLAKRGSSIYRDRPPFSIFGVGEYSFALWKVAISGFYKRLVFTVVGPVEDKPTVFDDTSYFLPCDSRARRRAKGAATLALFPD